MFDKDIKYSPLFEEAPQARERLALTIKKFFRVLVYFF